jgi:aminoglycoside phosphotransferase (APT) family kinase protein
LKGYKEINKIHKGYSSDQKFDVLFCDEKRYVLRTFDIKAILQKEKEFNVLKKMQELGVKCSAPIEFGQIEHLGIGFMVLTYIEGNDASEELNQLTKQEQYLIGVEAGKELFKMHQCHAPSSIPTWYEAKYKKHMRYMDQYSSCGVKVKNDTEIIAFINEHIHLMKNRPNTFQHDDFHVGNLIVKNKRLSGIIDFNRYDWGDPIHEFLKVGIFSSEVSIPYSIGQIRGYYNDNEPDQNFWELYSLYLAMCIFSSVVWILKVGNCQASCRYIS